MLGVQARKEKQSLYRRGNRGRQKAKDGKLEEELNSRIKAATKFYHATNKCLINKEDISEETKPSVYNAV